jgi:hypothetical protein
MQYVCPQNEILRNDAAKMFLMQQRQLTGLRRRRSAIFRGPPSSAKTSLIMDEVRWRSNGHYMGQKDSTPGIFGVLERGQMTNSMGYLIVDCLWPQKVIERKLDLYYMDEIDLLRLENIHALSEESRQQILRFVKAPGKANLTIYATAITQNPASFASSMIDEILGEYRSFDMDIPYRDEVIAWLDDRCREWQLTLESRDVLCALYERSNGHFGWMMNGLALSADSPSRRVTGQIIRSLPVIK